MQIEIDFDVFKALTTMRDSELDSYNSVIRRLLALPEQAEVQSSEASRVMHAAVGVPLGLGYASNATEGASGMWFGKTHFPDGTKLRATYKGQTYLAEIKNGKWLDAMGIVRTSPSDAAGAISGTNVNGWKFWHAQVPPGTEWHRLDEFK